MFAFRIVCQTFGLFFLLQNVAGEDMSDMMRNKVTKLGKSKVYLENNKEQYKFLTTDGVMTSSTLEFKQIGSHVGGWRDKAPIDLALCQRSDTGNGVDYLYYLAKVDSNNLPKECFQVTASFDDATSIGTLQRTNSDGKVEKYKNFNKDHTQKLIFKKQETDEAEKAEETAQADEPAQVAEFQVVEGDHNKNFKEHFLQMAVGGENHGCYVELQKGRFVGENPIPNIYFGIKCENKESIKNKYFHADHTNNDCVYAENKEEGVSVAVVLCPENSKYVLRESNGNRNLKDCFDVKYDENENVLIKVWDSTKTFTYDKVDANDKNKLVFKATTEKTPTRRFSNMNNHKTRRNRRKLYVYRR